MNRDSTSPPSYLHSIETGWQKERVAEIRELILAAYPGIPEGIGYGMLAYGKLGHLAAQKNHVALYVDPAALARFKKTHPNYDCGKSCLRFRATTEFNPKHIRDLFAEIGALK